MRFDYERHNDNEYVVKKGDSLYTISKKYNVSVDDLLKVNGLTSALIYPNQVLIIPLTNNGNVYFMEYVVKENDSLKQNILERLDALETLTWEDVKKEY